MIKTARFALALTPLAALGACAGSSPYYMGIDTRPSAGSTQLAPDQLQLEQRRQMLMLIAMLDGCYERTPFGFKVIDPKDAKTIPCESRLAEIEVLSRELGTGRGPTGEAAFSAQELARLARMGNKNAQLELGIRFEEGIGVERDMKRAKKLYGKAAADSGGTIWVYVPPVGNGTSGRVMPVDTGPKQYGLAEAKKRLAGLE